MGQQVWQGKGRNDAPFQALKDQAQARKERMALFMQHPPKEAKRWALPRFAEIEAMIDLENQMLVDALFKKEREFRRVVEENPRPIPARQLPSTLPSTYNRQLLMAAWRIGIIQDDWTSGCYKSATRVTMPDGQSYALKCARWTYEADPRRGEKDIIRELVMQWVGDVTEDQVIKHVAWGRIRGTLYVLQPWAKREGITSREADSLGFADVHEGHNAGVDVDGRVKAFDWGVEAIYGSRMKSGINYDGELLPITHFYEGG